MKTNCFKCGKETIRQNPTLEDRIREKFNWKEIPYMCSECSRNIKYEKYIPKNNWERIELFIKGNGFDKMFYFTLGYVIIIIILVVIQCLIGGIK